MDNAAVEACLKNEGIMNKIREVQETASNQYKVQSTPTFFINEEKLEGAQPFEVMSKAIDKAIADAK